MSVRSLLRAGDRRRTDADDEELAVPEQLDRAGIERAHIVGNSLGGWVALELARRGRARSVVLFGPAGAWRSAVRMSAVAIGLRLSFVLLARQADRADAIARRY